MLKSVELTAIDLSIERGIRNSAITGRDEDEGGEHLDDLEQPVPVNAPAPDGAEPVGLYFPVMIYEGDVREYYPRKSGRSGTRIVFNNGAARPVKESYSEVKAKFAGLAN